jgi:methylenetetrahydrofolate--tRNA-(uracil-5-)-methyltransferase
MKINIIGAGLAGCEACYYLSKKGYEIDLYEMRPKKITPAHKTEKLFDLVCSN